MIVLLDTNLVSELMRSQPDPRVLDWVAAQPVSDMASATITVMEIRFGIALLPPSRRRTELDTRFRQFLAQAFGGRALAFDQATADACAEIRVQRRRIGRPITTEDTVIAAIARVHGAPVVTRDFGGFEALINPWQD